jgi:hypothetical protein
MDEAEMMIPRLSTWDGEHIQWIDTLLRPRNAGFCPILITKSIAQRLQWSTGGMRYQLLRIKPVTYHWSLRRRNGKKGNQVLALINIRTPGL